MGLISCVECGREISDKAEACPHCGCPRQPLLPDSVCCLDCKKAFPFDDDVCPFCGLFNSQKHNLLAELRVEPEVMTAVDQDTAVICPKCRARNAVAAERKGFGLGKALVGGALVGGVGLLGGFIGSRKTVITCLKCNYKWSPGT